MHITNRYYGSHHNPQEKINSPCNIKAYRNMNGSFDQKNAVFSIMKIYMKVEHSFSNLGLGGREIQLDILAMSEDFGELHPKPVHSVHPYISPLNYRQPPKCTIS